AAGAFVGLFLLSRVLFWAVGRAPFCLTRPADPAGLPLILLLSVLATWATAPVQSAVSRHFESQADWESLELAGKPQVYIDTEVRMARDNKSNLLPSPFA